MLEDVLHGDVPVVGQVPHCLRRMEGALEAFQPGAVLLAGNLVHEEAVLESLERLWVLRHLRQADLRYVGGAVVVLVDDIVVALVVCADVDRQVHDLPQGEECHQGAGRRGELVLLLLIFFIIFFFLYDYIRWRWQVPHVLGRLH